MTTKLFGLLPRKGCQTRKHACIRLHHWQVSLLKVRQKGGKACSLLLNLAKLIIIKMFEIWGVKRL